MEKYSENKQQQIFKFSNISNILMYYGFLDEWKRLMKRLSSQTREIWNNNEDAFLNFGYSKRRELFVDNKIRDNFKEFSENHMLFNYILIDKDQVIDLINEILCQIQDNQMVIFYQSSFTSWFHLGIINDNINDDTYYEFKCKLHKPKVEYFKELRKRLIMYYIKEILYYSIISIKKVSGCFEVMSTISPILKLTEVLWDDNERIRAEMLEYDRSQNDECTCKPNTLIVNKYTLEYLVDGTRIATPFKNSIKNIIVRMRENDCHNWLPLKLMEAYNLSHIEYQLVKIPNIRKNCDIILQLNSINLTPIMGKNTYTLIYPLPEIYCSGYMIDHPINEGDKWLAFELRHIDISIWKVIKQNEDYHKNWDALKDIDDLRQINKFFVIVKKDNIIHINTRKLEYLKYTNNAKNLISWDINLNSDVNIDHIVDYINFVPRNIKLQLALWEENESILMREEFWTWVLSFNSFQLCQYNKQIIFSPISEHIIDKADIFKSLWNITKDNKWIILDLDSIISYILS